MSTEVRAEAASATLSKGGVHRPAAMKKGLSAVDSDTVKAEKAEENSCAGTA
jgi:hypothetical protein